MSSASILHQPPPQQPLLSSSDNYRRISSADLLASTSPSTMPVTSTTNIPSLGWTREQKRRLHTLNNTHTYPTWANDHANATCSSACGLSTSSWANAALHQTADDPSWANSRVLDGFTLAEAALEGLSDVSAAMDHLQHVLDLCWNSSSGPLNESAFAVAFGKAFAREATAFVHVLDQDLERPNLRTELTRQDMYEVFWHQAQARRRASPQSPAESTQQQSPPPPFTVIDMQPLVMGMVEFTLQQQEPLGLTSTRIRTIRFHAWTRHGQVTRLEHEETNTVVYGDDDAAKKTANNASSIQDDTMVLVLLDQPEAATTTVAGAMPGVAAAKSVRTDRATRPRRLSKKKALQSNQNKKRRSGLSRRNRRKVVAL